MDTSGNKSRAEEQMEHLERAVRESLKRAFPVPEQHRESVKEIVRKQLAAERELTPEQRQARAEQERKRRMQEEAQRQQQQQQGQERQR